MILHATNSVPGFLSIIIFFAAYILVITEEFTQLRKSKPVIVASGLIWLLVAYVAKQHDLVHVAEHAVKSNIQEYGELFLFLLVAMTYVNVMQENKIFDALRTKLVNYKFTFKQLFWATGLLAFFLSPLVDNLTTALIMSAVVITTGANNKKFIALSCINIVVAANAGGAYSPFGDITSLMVWQNGKLPFVAFFKIFFPAAISFVIPAAIMSYFIPNTKPSAHIKDIKMHADGTVIMILFALTIFSAVAFRVWFNLPPVLGMMMGLGYLHMFKYYLKMTDIVKNDSSQLAGLAAVEWDTLLFFYGIMLSIGGLATLGYLDYLTTALYQDVNLGLIVLGLVSAVIHNIPVLYSVLTMDPVMSEGQWLLITLTTGIGGSILAIGSAAGVALMGQAREAYTFFSHLKWTPVIILGYAAGVAAHMWLNKSLF